MGCDIHWCLEVKTDEGWVGFMVSDGSACRAADRNYRFFAELAGVRPTLDREYPEPRGLPGDVSALARFSAAEGSWDHSHSWCSLADFVAAYARGSASWQPPQEPLSMEKLFGLDYWPHEPIEARVVFAFDN